MALTSAIDLAAGTAARGALRMDGVRGRSLSILMYHRVLPQTDPLFPGEVDAARFDAQMRLLARSFNVLPLAEAARRLHDGSLPSRSLVITFDDGYADNHDVAAPILRRHGLKACFFVATSFLDGGRMWNDTVIECVRRSRHDAIDLAPFGLGRFVLGSPAQRRQAVDALLGVIKYQTVAQRSLALEQLCKLCAAQTLPDDLMMRSDQVRSLHAQGMEIGAHTVHHPILCTLDPDSARREMADSRACLQALVDAPVTLFAYPNGRPDKDYAAVHVAMARELGFTAAVTTATGVATGGADLHQLPRFTPWDRQPNRWLMRLASSRWQRGYRRACD